MKIEFLKWREHMNTSSSKQRIAVINRSTGKWEIFPMLNKTQRSIWSELKKGKTAKDIISIKEGMSKANVHKVIKILKSEGVIEDEIN
jgi:predicted transcriptional regulator